MQHFVVLPSQPYYLPSEYSTLGDKLKEVGYMNHVVGNQPPIFTGIDFRDNTGVVTHQNGTHNTFLFSERAEKIVRNHNPASPLFLYVAYMVPHFPIQVPAGFEESVQVDDANRKAYAGMMAAMDQGVGNITQALKDTGMWDDTLFVFLSDNGGDDVFAGSNYPYRGNKGSTFEGGMKVPAFFHGSMLQDPSTVNNELYHFTDVFATLVSVAGGELETDIDGVNQWDSICRGEPSKRSDILLHYDTHPDTTGLAYRMGDYKYIEGITTTWPFRRFSNDLFHFDQWFRPAENPSAPIPDAPFITEDENNRFLFNLKDDPLETNNLYYDPDEQNVVIEIEQRLEEYRASISPIWYPGALDPRSDPAKFGGFWTPGWC
ncbi:arylsulfatase J-like [Saccoglossus kowalevskii]